MFDKISIKLYSKRYVKKNKKKIKQFILKRLEEEFEFEEFFGNININNKILKNFAKIEIRDCVMRDRTYITVIVCFDTYTVYFPELKTPDELITDIVYFPRFISLEEKDDNFTDLLDSLIADEIALKLERVN